MWAGKFVQLHMAGAVESRPRGLPGTYQGSSSNTGVFRVRKRRITGFPSCTRGFPVRKESANIGNSGSQAQRERTEQQPCYYQKSIRLWFKKGPFSLVGVMRQKQKGQPRLLSETKRKHAPFSLLLTFHEHSQTFTTRVPNHGMDLSPKPVTGQEHSNVALPTFHHSSHRH